ncbi:hypothetical protein DOM22_05720 [Bdellovibrio sp. ZAP7]|uniref:helix-turn-helix domain-containing protein n=1 Tax=Bdellovibrio sp. ZAP7 TaxID=2231053 RepID=UPI00115A470C|nr:hypothetical protein DOM22_05720 [Bdellovibrio sp. ZAP7]
MSPDRFREIRLGLNLTQADTALILGVADKTVISRYEAGGRRPNNLMSAVMEVLASLPRKESERLVELLKKHVALQRSDN